MKKENAELQIIDSSEFGIEPKKAKEITSGLTTILSERKVLEESYVEVLKLEVTPENLPQFKALRIKIRDNRTKGIEAWHKVNKDFYLKGGQFVDAIKRKEALVNEQMEEKLLEAEKYFENLEKERLIKLNNDRKEAIKPYVEDLGPIDFSNMPDDVWTPYFESKKKAYEDKIESDRLEAERLETERIEKEKSVKLHNERKELLIEVWNFVPLDKRDIDFSTLTEEEFNERLEYSRKLHVADVAQKEATRLENERLKKEAEAKEKIRKERGDIMSPYIVYIRDYNKLLQMSDEDFKKEMKSIQRGAMEQMKYEADRLLAEEKERIAESKRKQQEFEKYTEERLKKESEQKAEAQRKLAEETAKKEAEKLAKAPVKEQLNLWVNNFEIPLPLIANETTLEIAKKFNAFKAWAKLEIDKL